jgi:hypothetical protein
MSDERGPGARTIELVMSAWQRAQAGLTADAMLEEDERAVLLPDDGIADTVDAVDAVLRRLGRAILFAGLRAEEAETLKKAMAFREKRYDARADMLRYTLLDILLLTNRRSFLAPEGTFFVRNVAASVVITDAAALADEYVTETTETVRKPNTAAIKADLDEGVVIDGAVLSNPGHGLTFRAARGPKDGPAAVEPKTPDYTPEA